ncbi:acyl-homoserine-lactone synthase [Burkholderia sp. Bp8998]|uniref:acyl-homoserine-lactone synthase n=1 Tax=Burkholderia sp. Bp8998 TaxID=2184557 RepID=UPI000F595624|nr:acyl-homoserine-lactone synthase [Burkholderia sp. Bp8998]RQS22670.1 acyl-homoserine-lactone synthase [Burkholderia sp. Bp8998]
MKPLIKIGRRNVFHQDEIQEMFRLRARVFRERLNWDVNVFDGMEVDSYDALDPRYLTVRASDGQLCGCWRILGTQGPYMLKNSFTHLLEGQPAPNAPDIWELSRFALASDTVTRQFGFSNPTVMSIASVLSYAHRSGITRYVTVTTPAIERMLRHLGVASRRFSPRNKVDTATPIALWIDVADSLSHLHRIPGLAAALPEHEQPVAEAA